MIMIGQNRTPFLALFSNDAEISYDLFPIALLFGQIRDDQVAVANLKIEADFLLRIIQHGIIRAMCSKSDQASFLKQALYFLCCPAKKVIKFNAGIAQFRHLAQRSFEILFQFFSKCIQLKAKF
ncbi:hypothetical protein D3C81_1716550 [compost metagenome]